MQKKTMKTRCCVLCLKAGTFSFKFPQKVAQIRHQWIDFCRNCIPDRNAKDTFDQHLTPESTLCVNHFSSDLICLADGTRNSRTKLRKTAVPTIPPDEGNLKDVWKGVCVTKKQNKLCYVCNETDDNVSHFYLREEWLPLFNISSFNKNLVICEKHFRPQDIEFRGFKSFLAKGALPILASSVSSHNIVEDPSAHLIVEIEETNSEIVPTNELPLKHCQSCTCSVKSYTSTSSQVEDDLFAHSSRNHNAVDVDAENNASTDVPPLTITPEKDDTYSTVRFKKPRYVGDIQTPHLNTPSSARYCLKLCRTTLSKKDSQIRNFRERENRFQKRITALENKILQLKENEDML